MEPFGADLGHEANRRPAPDVSLETLDRRRVHADDAFEGVYGFADARVEEMPRGGNNGAGRAAAEDFVVVVFVVVDESV